MDIQSVKVDLIHWLSELNDKSLIKKLQGLKEQQEKSFELSKEQKAELDDRLNKYDKEGMKFSTWDKTKERIRNRAKDTL